MNEINEPTTDKASATNAYAQQVGNEGLWTQIFAEGHPALLKQHRFHKKLPKEPRCRLCYVPFSGLGGWWMSLRGKQRNSRNPNFCNACDKFLAAYPGGAEITLSLLYVDIRNSTQYADSAAARAVSGRINAFLDKVTQVITDNDGFVMAFYGDCIVAVWPPGFSGPQHATKCLQAARQLVTHPPHDPAGDSIPMGVGINTGKVFIGTVSALQGSFRDVSIFGRNVNITARLAAAAKAGEALTTSDLLTAAGSNINILESRELQMKGIEETVKAYSIA